ncbi:MAG: HEPN domain-containing protein [Bryobacteraceae bacterium]
MTVSPSADQLLDDFAIRSFSDLADGDYIAARMACRAELMAQFLWSSQQAIEKYLKCILLLRRIPATKPTHDLGSCLSAIRNSQKLSLALTAGTEEFFEYLDRFAMCRYLEIPTAAFGGQLVTLDRAVWELRRFCTLEPGPQGATLRDKFPAPLVRLEGRYLEKVIDSPRDPARRPLLWHNAFFGNRKRRTVLVYPWFKAQNPPLTLNPQILDEVLKYVFMPKDLVNAYRGKTRGETK